MNWFSRFSDALARVWAGAPWFAFCLFALMAWLVYGVINSLWTDDVWHLALNSPTTGLTFLGLYALHNATARFEKATNRRLCALIESLGIPDPVLDEGQREPPEQEEVQPQEAK